MALSRDDFVRASRGERIELPSGTFGPPQERGETWPDWPDLRRAVEWFKSFLSPADWEARRYAAFVRLHVAAMGLTPHDRVGRYFDDSDTFGWYLFLADAFLDHLWNYEPMYGSRVIPVFAGIGRDLDLLLSVTGLEDRVRRLATSERRQPNGGIFELLVAAAYRRAGAQVAFRAELPGVARTYDMDVELHGQEFAVECKRMETGAYGERERARMRELWAPAMQLAVASGRSVFGNVDFFVPISEVPERYLFEHVSAWLASDMPSLSWGDAISRGVIGELDMAPLQNLLETDDVLVAGTRLHQLLAGRYIRHANYLQATKHREGMSPRYMTECELAVLLRWQSLSSRAINAKARDVLQKLADANGQLPTNKPSIVHIGFEAVDGDEVERARYEKILASTAAFDPVGKPLQFVFCHYFVPESPPEKAWAFEETVQWSRVTKTAVPPPHIPFLVVPVDGETRPGPHWQL